MPIRMAMALLCLGAFVFPAQGAENWFLPYAPDPHTVTLLHLDGQGDAAPNECAKAPAFKLVGGAERTRGQFGGGVLFDGIKASLNASPNDAFRLRNDQNFTIEMWVRPNSAAQGMLFSIGTRFYLGFDPGKRTGSFAYRAASFPMRYYPLTDLPIVRGQWQHIAVTHRRDRTVSLYVNGALAATVEHSAEGDFGKGGGANIGSHDGWTGYFKGAVDEVRISDCVRELRSLLAHMYYLKGESVRLQVDPESLPEEVARLQVRVLDARGKAVLERVLGGGAIGGDLFPASELPPGEHPVEVVFLRDTGEVISRVRTTVGYAEDLPDRLSERLATVEKACETAAGKAAPERVESARLLVQSARGRMEQRDFRAAESRTVAAERIAAALAGGEAAYRAAVRGLVRAGPTPRDVRITMSWDGGADLAPKALPWAQRLGANELVASESGATPEGFAIWKKAGYHTVMLAGLPIHDHAWITDHPDHAQTGYWVTNPVEAKGAEVEISVESCKWPGLRICTRLDPKTHWKIVDATDGKAVEPSRWETDGKSVRVRGAAPGHKYCAYFMIEMAQCGDPLLPVFSEHALSQLNEKLAPFKGVLDTYWFDDLSFAYPGPTPQGAWDWESYTMAARPESQERFTRETGIAFDPAWLVMPPRTIDVPPDPRYLAWMAWVQAALRPWLAQAAEVCRKNGMSSWLYWGDCHVGMEPYRGSLAGGPQELDKPASDPVTARALVDFPGDTKRRLRVEWLFPHVAASDDSPDRLLTQWAKARRGLLMRPASGLYWMPFPDVVAGRDAGVREDIVETLAEIDDEFRLIGDHLAGTAAFTHDINLYVVNSWGSVYSWRPWGSPILTPLTDLPVRVHFISFAEIEEKGIPADCNAVFLHGMPGTAWSGSSRWWEPGKVADAVRAFVEKGGGVIALQAPSHVEKPQPHWALGDLLGVRAEGTAEYKAAQTDLSQLADTGATMNADLDKGGLLQAVKGADECWLARETASVGGLQEAVHVAATPGSRTLYVARQREGATPGVVVSEQGKGRVAYLCGWSSEYAFSRLVRRAVFWVARREADFDRLDVTGGEDLFIYAYPAEHLLAVASNTKVPANARLRLDPAILQANKGPGAKRAIYDLRLVDITTEQKIWEGDAKELAEGVSIGTVPRCVRLLRLE